ncbi:MAG: hypothetical protein KJO07_02865, partial [Deltaproteobacteria bacterium]|nr:hypothetical protein [Deltaproteobacteria bacterium]
MSWMQRFMARFGYVKNGTAKEETEDFADALCHFAEGTAETERPLSRRPATVGELPLEPEQFEDTVYDLMPSDIIFDDSYRVEDKETLRGWSPDPNVFSSACSHRPVTSVVDRIDSPRPRPRSSFRGRSALERLLDPNLSYAEPYT